MSLAAADGLRHGLVVGSIAHQIQCVMAGGDVATLRRPPAGRVACTHCGRSAPVLDPAVISWGRSPCDGAQWKHHRVCSECMVRLVEPAVVVVDDWGNAMDREGPWFPGSEAYASQFAGARTIWLVFPPEATHGRLALPDHRTDQGMVEHVGDDAIIYKILCI